MDIAIFKIFIMIACKIEKVHGKERGERERGREKKMVFFNQGLPVWAH